MQQFGHKIIKTACIMNYDDDNTNCSSNKKSKNSDERPHRPHPPHVSPVASESILISRSFTVTRCPLQTSLQPHDAAAFAAYTC